MRGSRREIVIGTVGMATCFASIGCDSARKGSEDYLSKVDHLIYATPDLDVGVRAIEEKLGVEAVPGGRHPGFGTRNALIALGDATYLEIIGPDREQPELEGARIFDVDALEAPRLVSWVAKGTDLEQLVEDAKRGGVELGTVASGSRLRPDGVLLSWRLTDPRAVREQGIVPFFIDWGETPHPAGNSPRCCALVGLRAEHPDAERVSAMLAFLGLGLNVETGPAPALIATISTPRGTVELR